jgi:hypothetical protein
MAVRFAQMAASPADGEKFVCASLPNGYIKVVSTKELLQWLKRLLWPRTWV